MVDFVRTRVMALAGLSLAACAFAAPAMAQQQGDVVRPAGEQQEPAPPADEIDRIPGAPAPGTRVTGPRADAVRIVRPGALLIASFDANHDARVSRAELETGAAASFTLADRNGDGAITGFEQNEWSSAVNSSSDVLSNPMAFDANLDRSITRDEFIAGLKRIAEPMAEAGSGEIPFSALVRPLSGPEQQADRGPPPGLRPLGNPNFGSARAN